MATIRCFEEIEAWKTARELTMLVYRLSGTGQFECDFGLKNQMQRAAVSVMSNIAEGFESASQAQFIKYLNYAKASAGEVRSQLYVARDLNYISTEDFELSFDLAEKASAQLARFIGYLERNANARLVREEIAIYEI